MARLFPPGTISHRKRNQLPLDGNVAGLPYNRPHGHPVTAPISLGTPRQEEYDPVFSQYQHPDPEYDAPPSWFDGFHVAPTPMIRTGSAVHDIDHEANHDDGLMTPQLMDQILDELWQDEQPSDPMSLEEAAGTPDFSLHHAIDDVGAPVADPMDELALMDPYEVDPAPIEDSSAAAPYGIEFDAAYVVDDLGTPDPADELNAAGLHDAPMDELDGLEQLVQDAMPSAPELMASFNGTEMAEMSGPESQPALEDIVNDGAGMPGTPQYDDLPMTPELFQQAMNDAIDQMQPDPYEDMQDMYDPMGPSGNMMPGPDVMPGFGPHGM